jgi:hypothetical protein
MRTIVVASSCLLFLLTVLSACAGEGQSPPSAAASAPQSSEPASHSASDGEPPTVSLRKLVKTVQLTLQVDDTEAVAVEVRALAATTGGYVSAVSAHRRNELLFYEMTLRVPVERLEQVLGQLRGLAVRVDGESLTTEDVTERYVDLEARIRTLEATEVELKALLAESRDRRSDIEDVMKIYEKLIEIRTRIEQLQGKLNALGNLAALSTIHVELRSTESSRPMIADKWRPSETFHRSFRSLVVIFQTLVDLFIYCLVVILPSGLLIVLPYLGLAKLWRRWKRRRGAI